MSSVEKESDIANKSNEDAAWCISYETTDHRLTPQISKFVDRVSSFTKKRASKVHFSYDDPDRYVYAKNDYDTKAALNLGDSDHLTGQESLGKPILLLFL